MTAAYTRPSNVLKRWIRGLTGRWMDFALVGVVLAIVAIFTATVVWSRGAAREEASRELSSTVAALEQEITHNISVLDLSFRSTIASMRSPAVMASVPELRRRLLFDTAASAEYVSRLFVLDATGTVILDSRHDAPEPVSEADQSYFLAHRDDAGLGLYVSEPMTDPDGQWVVGLSRRFSNPDGSFAGVVVATLRLAYFHTLSARMQLRPGVSMLLVKSDGTVLIRAPHDPRLVGLRLPASMRPDFLDSDRTGEVELTPPTDNIPRVLQYRQLRHWPLMLIVARPKADIYAEWQQRSLFIGVTLMALCVAILALMRRLQAELRQRARAEQALLELSEIDPLTGLANRRRFDKVLGEEWARAQRHGTPVGLLMVDADHFKMFNDTLGHLAGDAALMALALSLKQRARRPGDLAARYGGEEFAVVLPQTDLGGAVMIADAIRRNVADLAIAHPGSGHRLLSVSIGIAVMRPQADAPVASLIAMADEALYRAKHQGRNRCAIGRDPAEDAAMLLSA